MLDLEPATKVMAALVVGVRDDQLALPVPGLEWSLADLLDHVYGLAGAFADGARKIVPDGGSAAPSVDGKNLDSDWRRSIPARLETLGAAWQDEAAWAGVAEVGGVELPSEMHGMFALDEVVVHGWDVAIASGQPFAMPANLIEENLGFIEGFVAQQPNGTPGSVRRAGPDSSGRAGAGQVAEPHRTSPRRGRPALTCLDLPTVSSGRARL